MKSKLLLFLTFIGLASYAQFTINEGFETPVWPAGWTNDGFSINTGANCSSVYGASKQFSQASPFGGFATSNNTSNGNLISFSVDYYVASTGSNPGWNNVKTSYSINNGGWITLTVGTIGQMSGNCGTLSATIPAGTVPTGAQVKFAFEGFRQSNTTVLRFDNILITQAVIPAAPAITDISATPSFNTAQINYTLNANNVNTTSLIRYGLTEAGLNQSITGFNASGSANVSDNVILPGLAENTQYYYQVEAENTEGIVTSDILTFTTIEILPPTIVSIEALPSQTSATINITGNANGATTSSLVRYGLTSDNLNLSQSGTEINGNANAVAEVILNGLMPNTTYYYEIELDSENGTTIDGVFSFVTLDANIIAQYNFDNTYNNVIGNTPFSTNSGTSFTTDRHGNANGAININNTGTIATIPNLPYGNSARTISVWAKTNVLNNQINYVFHYGNQANGNGLAFRPNETLYFANAAGNLNAPDTNTNNTWIHYVCTFDGTIAKVYKNGVLFNSGVMAWNTVNNANSFKLGISEGDFLGFFNGAIDDLKIYNVALNQSQVTGLFLNNNLSNDSFENLSQTILFPNPVTDTFTIKSGFEIEKVEVYNLTGQLVYQSKTTENNISNLINGVYLVKVTDDLQNVTTSKLIKK